MQNFKNKNFFLCNISKPKISFQKIKTALRFIFSKQGILITENGIVETFNYSDLSDINNTVANVLANLIKIEATVEHERQSKLIQELIYN